MHVPDTLDATLPGRKMVSLGPRRRRRRGAGLAEHPMNDFTHFDAGGASRMVDVGAKPVTRRTARASATVRMQAATRAAIAALGGIAKGNVYEVARLAGIMAAKRTAELIPLCHPLPLDSITVDFELEGEDALRINATAVATARTGVEMEALTAATTAALTVYDMCKAVDRSMTIERVQLEEKTGGVRGDYLRGEVARGERGA
jgi:cyclic pyranopterin monophosphate synthase